MDPRSSDKALTATQASPTSHEHPGVRFAPTVEEIAPATALNSSTPIPRITAPIQAPAPGQFDLHGDFPRERRLSHFHFEPVSLPASRTTSVEGSPTKAHHDDMISGISSHNQQAMQSPPLTPAGTAGYSIPREATHPDPEKGPHGIREPQLITPQHSSSVDEQSEKTLAMRHQPDHKSHRKGIFSFGGESSNGSTSVSRDASPSRASELYSRPVTPAVGDVDGPYAAKNRRQQAHPSNKRSFGKEHKTGSFATLKRFFKRAVSGETTKHDASHSSRKKPGKKTPPTSSSGETAPFSDDHLLEAKYGKIDRVLGSGAGGSVMLMKRDDGRVFAVKEFRQRQARESKRRYTKKITAEFCVASALHHSNVIETMDIVESRDRWFQVMEFAPTISFPSSCLGRCPARSCGVAHRDLKLDNVVVTKGGIMKIIDFGSAHVFQYPHETAIQYAEGVVGSDPYMAPEVYDPNTKAYDPRASDVWSLAIIFCCMTLKRFPWRIPAAAQDKSFRLFTSPPSVGHDPRHLLLHSKSSANLSKKPNEAESTPSSPDDHARGRDEGANGDAKQRSQSQGAEATEKREVISGPWRILRQLPRETRHIVWRMLEVDPKSVQRWKRLSGTHGSPTQLSAEKRNSAKSFTLPGISIR
ncbi:unnamed protein product [Parascedosporium putredinis]|uniref:mitogen-activated protein kinase kinase n=1 Tax=Parascedosporium putredinis TaxID=1442378 RepID=A0A9P1H7T4_9PEZI|nr:unnamed protein product [Parascedosporium putredinis]CAI7998751.1 unnamed protein product [Parascedosporium putredinis]